MFLCLLQRDYCDVVVDLIILAIFLASVVYEKGLPVQPASGSATVAKVTRISLE